MHPSVCLVIPEEIRRLIAHKVSQVTLYLSGASKCLFGDSEEIRRLNAHKVSQVTHYLLGASKCLFGDPEEIRRLNAHKVSQVTHYLSGDPCGVPKAMMPTRSHRCSPVCVCVCVCSIYVYLHVVSPCYCNVS